ncbi:hypothetical protein Bca4012_065117 [Brassica carinata]
MATPIATKQRTFWIKSSDNMMNRVMGDEDEEWARRKNERNDGDEEWVMMRWVMTRWREVMSDEELVIRR